MKEQITLTALPYDIRYNVDPLNRPGRHALRLSVFVSPRAQRETGDPTAFHAKDLPIFKDWPAVAGKLKFNVCLQPPSAQPTPGTPAPPLTLDATITRHPFDSKLWHALFDPLDVDVFEGNTAEALTRGKDLLPNQGNPPSSTGSAPGMVAPDRSITSYPVRQAHDSLQDSYRTVMGQALSDQMKAAAKDKAAKAVAASSAAGAAAPLATPNPNGPAALVAEPTPAPTPIPTSKVRELPPLPYPDLDSLAEEFGPYGEIGLPAPKVEEPGSAGLAGTSSPGATPAAGVAALEKPRTVSRARSDVKGSDDSPLGQAYTFLTSPILTETAQLLGLRAGAETGGEAGAFITGTPRYIPNFHERLTHLSFYPSLMRRLGLIFDLTVYWDQHTNFPQDGLVWVEIENGAAASTPPLTPANTTSPRTRYRVDLLKGRFYAKPRLQETGLEAEKPAVEEGRLPLNDPERFQVVDMDIDGASLNAISFGRNVNQVKESKAPDKPASLSLPALRSAGISVVYSHIVAEMKRALARQDAMIAQRNKLLEDVQKLLDDNQALPEADRLKLVKDLEQREAIELEAEDLVAGHRIDIWRTEDRHRQWRSLFERRVDFEILDYPGSPAPLYPFQEKLGPVRGPNTLFDEGWVSLSLTHQLTDSGAKNYLHESLFTWRGWSLTASSPIKAVDENGGMEDASPQPGVSSSNNLIAHTKAKRGSLPSLRFGHHYRLRARAVDLAGNDMVPHGLNDANLNVCIPPSQDPPLPHRRSEPVPSPLVLPRTPLRHRLGESVEHLVIDGRTRDSAERHIVPPKTSVEMAMLHGMLDDETGLSKEKYPLIPQYSRDWSEANDGAQPAALLHMPYLSDPLSRGAAFRGLPGFPGSVAIPFSGRWPDIKPFRLVLLKGDHPPFWDDSKRELLVYLPPGHQLKVRLSSHFNSTSPRDLEMMKIWEWLRDVVPQPDPRDGLRGQLWMLTPYRELTLTHAVQQPVDVPTFNNGEGDDDMPALGVTKHIGDTFATVEGDIFFHAPSTGHLELLAGWNEWDDSLPAPGEPDLGPRMLPGQAPHPTGFKLDIAYPEPHEAGGHSHFKVEHSFGDTKHRMVTYFAEATTRYAEHFVPRTNGQSHISPDDPAPRVQDGIPLTKTTPEILQSISKAGDGKHAPKLQAVRGRPVCVIQSSARPMVPEVLYIVPLFGWEDPQVIEEKDKKKKTVKRETTKRRCIGGGLRIYLNRGWYSSGEGEMLGVVTWPLATSYLNGSRLARFTGQFGILRKPMEIMREVKSYVSHWGEDPLWQSAGGLPAPGLGLNHFLNADATATDLTLQELLPENPGLLRAEEILDLRGWLREFKTNALHPKISPYIFDRLDQDVQNAINNYDDTAAPTQDLLATVVAGFNRKLGDVAAIYDGKGLYPPDPNTPPAQTNDGTFEQEKFAVTDSLGKLITTVVTSTVKSASQIHEMNRRLLQELYPAMIEPFLPYPADLLMSVAAFQPKFDHERKLWYVDVHLDGGSAYRPFVRLALTRYQPHSVTELDAAGAIKNDCHLSRVVLADFAQLTPERTVSMVFEPAKPKQVFLGVHGVTGVNKALASPASKGTRVRATLCHRVAGNLDRRELLTDHQIWLEPFTPPGSVQTAWKNNLPLTLKEKRGHGQYEILFEEFEYYEIDPATPGAKPGQDKRLVFADHLPL